MLSPDQRVTIFDGDVVHLDNPSLDAATAWRRGQVILDDTPLSSAVAEMNRYSSLQLVVEEPKAAGLLVEWSVSCG